jgi:hypothetical protein
MNADKNGSEQKQNGFAQEGFSREESGASRSPKGKKK